MSLFAIDPKYFSDWDMSHPSRMHNTIQGYKSWIDHLFEPQMDSGWRPSQWVDFLRRVEYLPGWSIRVEVEINGIYPMVKLICVPPEFEGLDKLNLVHVVSPHWPRDEKEAGLVIDRVLLQVHDTIHRAAMKVRES